MEANRTSLETAAKLHRDPALGAQLAQLYVARLDFLERLPRAGDDDST